MEKLALLLIVQDAVRLPFARPAEFFRGLAPPTLALVLVWAAWLVASPESAELNWAMYFLYLLAFCAFAVASHRLALLPTAQYRISPSQALYTVGRFAFYFIVVFGLREAIELVFVTFYVNSLSVPIHGEFAPEMAKSTSEDTQSRIDAAESIIFLPVMYFVARFSLVFPATAIGFKVGLRWSWKATAGHGLYLTFLIAIFPWFLAVLIGYAWREGATLIEQVLLSLAVYLTTAVGVFALSGAYRELARNEQEKL